MGIALAVVALLVFSSSFNNLYGEFLALLIIFLAPWCAIYLTDAWLRRNTYDPAGLLVRVGGPYWYQAGINMAGLIAQIVGMVASALWLHSSLLQGPLSRVFGGSDMSVFTGFIVGGVLYWILSRSLIPPVAPIQQTQYEDVELSSA